ncbi:hypothetical protein N474_23720 [Pseudoalteromonas luteoviolacea CPMOR-2]|uniref:Pectate lyase superfamily protein domain-containing protein n=1 Tax=Pseudoalteromonas luteoviolacea DSM 6061 TaxID=1365250 RepID=A0A166UJ33_9GAMM|nr:hypothetical protein [Pseudoalteromonas luteoviolacea]KZN30735.1 hypothetical protein N475_04840 [Pseudoalteromonas luteoviolacea DSM 6061]KZN51684.1 hypothetical protein N474_23720 [Pseudoalteromonas luteoviolacea CPMOR-2]MBE0386467.1 hypothetical protein [Pseudoalteromonas luteoviolacea DSM 6061]
MDLASKNRRNFIKKVSVTGISGVGVVAASSSFANESNVQSTALFHSVEAMRNALHRVGDVITTLGYHDAHDGGGNQYLVTMDPSITPDNGEYIALNNSGLLAKGLFPSGGHNIKQWGAKNDGSDCSEQIKNALIWQQSAPNRVLYGASGTFVINETISISTGLKSVFSTYLTRTYPLILIGHRDCVLKANGQNRVYHFRFPQARHDHLIEGICFDGSGIVERVVTFESTGMPSNGEINIAQGTTIKNGLAIGVYCYGEFARVYFDGTIRDIVSSQPNSTTGLSIAPGPSNNEYTKHLVVGSCAFISSISNGYTPTRDADGVIFVAMREISQRHDATFTVEPGATFENCQGRAIKSQVVNNIIVGPVIKRDSCNGLVDIDLQYGGGSVSNAVIIHKNSTVTYAIGVTKRALPNISSASITHNTLSVIQDNATSDLTTAMVGVAVAQSVPLNGILIQGNKVEGKVEYFSTLRISELTSGVNEVTINDNYLKEAQSAFLQVWAYNGGYPTLFVRSSGNFAEHTTLHTKQIQNTRAFPLVWNNSGIMPLNMMSEVRLGHTLSNISGNAQEHVLAFDNITSDHSGLYDSSTGEFKAPFDGALKFQCNLELHKIDDAHSDLELIILTNSALSDSYVANSVNLQTMKSSNNTYNLKESGELQVQKGDTITFQVKVTGGNNALDIAASQNTFIKVTASPL